MTEAILSSYVVQGKLSTCLICYCFRHSIGSKQSGTSPIGHVPSHVLFSQLCVNDVQGTALQTPTPQLWGLGPPPPGRPGAQCGRASCQHQAARSLASCAPRSGAGAHGSQAGCVWTHVLKAARAARCPSTFSSGGVWPSRALRPALVSGRRFG